MPALALNIQRDQLPRSQVGRRPEHAFAFEIGDTVTFHGDLAIVTDRQRSFAGREIYDITLECADRPHRTVRGEFLAKDDDRRKARNGAAIVREAERAMRLLSQVPTPQLLAA